MLVKATLLGYNASNIENTIRNASHDPSLIRSLLPKRLLRSLEAIHRL